MKFEAPYVRFDYPFKLPLIGEWVYYRHEETSCLLNYSGIPLDSKIDIALDEHNVNLRLSAGCD